ncbi:hypothetical protein HFO58_11025 [Rhizobium leguminosarum]|uniref:winged helix-turn-helix domain-containing protein n=1 Tax=Rhizobium leguminosarum TaxID=384 RepID=UPI001C93A34A|nr:winged helix-turn-helix domain-containing protein [Rhizobium leguminosarum]MBY5533689.1 hypothetical protein [Rhizobium leguminosarum]
MLDAYPRAEGRNDSHTSGGMLFDDQSVRRSWPIYEFGPFVANSRSRKLLQDGNPVSIGGRAFKILLMLLGSPGTAFSKDEILRHVWPSVFVAEGNVKVQISYLRKSLGSFSDLIVCVSGDGYAFTGQVDIN